MCERRGALAGVGWHPHGAGRPFPGHSRLGTGDTEAMRRLRAPGARQTLEPHPNKDRRAEQAEEGLLTHHSGRHGHCGLSGATLPVTAPGECSTS